MQKMPCAPLRKPPGLWPLWALKDLPSTGLPDKGVDDAPEPGEGEGGSVLVCRACGNRVAPVQAIMWAGEGGRVFCNPHGLVFEIIRLRAAPGCVCAGPAVNEFSWFPGHAWRIALCRGCGTHLGWRFEGESVFFGLIESALEEIGD